MKLIDKIHCILSCIIFGDHSKLGVLFISLKILIRPIFIHFVQKKIILRSTL